MRSMAEAGTKASRRPTRITRPLTGRVHLPVRPAGHDVVESADLLSRLVPDGTAEHAGQRDDGVEDALGGENATRPAAALVRGPPRIAGSAGKKARAVRCARRRWRGHGATSCGVLEGTGSDRTAGGAARGASVGSAPGACLRAVPAFGSYGTLSDANQLQHGVGHAPAVLLGGSPLDMATPPSPSSLCGCESRRTIPVGILPGWTGTATGRAARSPGVNRGGYRAAHGPRLPTGSRGLPDRNRRVAHAEPARRVGRAGLLHDARGTQGLQSRSGRPSSSRAAGSAPAGRRSTAAKG